MARAPGDPNAPLDARGEALGAAAEGVRGLRVECLRR
jgi:hypothetical protein